MKDKKKDLSYLLQKEVLAQKIYELDLLDRKAITYMKDKYIQDTLFTLRFLSSSLHVEEPLVFVNFMKWFGELAYHLKFNIESMKSHFEASHQIFESVFDNETYKLISEYYQKGVNSFIDSFSNSQFYNIEIDEFLEYLLSMESDKAYQYVIDKVEEGFDLKKVYLDILQPTLYKVGELWKQRIISVAKEHYITAVIQHIIGKLYSILFTEKAGSGYSITPVCVGDELHEIGMRMVADFFELSGWDSVFLGSNIPNQMIIEQLLDKKTNVLAVSATTPAHLLDINDLIHTIKNHSELKNIIIMVGGRVFNETPNLWKQIGADAFAMDANQAVILADLLMEERYES